MQRFRKRGYREGVPFWAWVVVGALGAALAIFGQDRPASADSVANKWPQPQKWDVPPPANVKNIQRTGSFLHASADGERNAIYVVPQQRPTYMLRSGSLQSTQKAEALKAQIALLGYASTIETAGDGSRVLYRVRLGPYRTAAELAEVKRRLAEGGVQSLPFVTR